MMNWTVTARLLLSFGLIACQNHPQIPPTPHQWVTDTVGLLTPDTRKALNEYLEAYETRSKHQVFVWIGSTLRGQDPSEWTLRVFNAWGIGRARHDDGVALFAWTTDDFRWITVGYGLEVALPDKEATRICREVIAPRMRSGHANEAIGDGVRSIIEDIDAWEKR